MKTSVSVSFQLKFSTLPAFYQLGDVVCLHKSLTTFLESSKPLVSWMTPVMMMMIVEMMMMILITFLEPIEPLASWITPVMMMMTRASNLARVK